MLSVEERLTNLEEQFKQLSEDIELRHVTIESNLLAMVSRSNEKTQVESKKKKKTKKRNYYQYAINKSDTTDWHVKKFVVSLFDKNEAYTKFASENTGNKNEIYSTFLKNIWSGVSKDKKDTFKDIYDNLETNLPKMKECKFNYSKYKSNNVEEDSSSYESSGD